MECIIYMGSEDVRRQALNVFRIEMLGGKVFALKIINYLVLTLCRSSPSTQAHVR